MTGAGGLGAATTTFFFLTTFFFFLGLQTVFVRRVPLILTFLQTFLTAAFFFLVVFLTATFRSRSADLDGCLSPGPRRRERMYGPALS